MKTMQQHSKYSRSMLLSLLTEKGGVINMKFYNVPSIEIIKIDTRDIMQWSLGSKDPFVEDPFGD